MEYQNVPDTVKLSHLSLAPMMLFDLGNKLILYICHNQTPCMYVKTFKYAQDQSVILWTNKNWEACYWNLTKLGIGPELITNGMVTETKPKKKQKPITGKNSKSPKSLVANKKIENNLGMEK
jgi:hypothetical protein